MSDLKEYAKKRDFAKTPEPAGEVSPAAGHTFVVQKHAASRLHYDFRLELDGVLKSWAVPKGPALDPGEKRLAVHVEDHPLEYASFEGVIPKGEYGGGTVMIWDRGTWRPRGDPAEGYKKGRLKFELEGEKLRGAWTLVRTRADEGDKESWLLVREKGSGEHPPVDDDHSVATGRTMEEIAAERARVWDHRGERPPVPDFVEPELATLVESVPTGAGWIYEVKYDGYRVIAAVSAGRARVWTRNANDWTAKFPEIAKAIERLPVDDAVLDGEVVAFDPRGVPSFQTLQAVLAGKRKAPLHLVVFDLLRLDGEDLRALPLWQRKERLRALPLAGALRYAEHVEEDGEAWLAEACKLGLEGIMAKRRDAPYRSGRLRDWLKAKCPKVDSFVVVGWTDPGGARTGFGSLHVAERTADGLRYAGKVGSGFDQRTLASLRERTKPRDTPPLPDAPRGKGAHWVEPELVAQISYTERTDEGLLRHPVFRGLRELPKVRLTNPKRQLWPDVGVTKEELAAYLVRVADRMLPHLTRRPLTLVRCPDGVHADCFYMRHYNPTLPTGIHPVKVPGRPEDYVYVDSVEGLVGLAQIGVLEVHPWGTTIDVPDKPDRLVFDLDPDPGLAWPALVAGAEALRERLAAVGLASFARVTGGKGLHVVVPIEPTAPWDVAKAFCRAVAEDLVRAEPDRYTAQALKKKRVGKVFVDWLRNAPTATAVGTWSPRARPGAPICVPVSWEELPSLGRGDRWRLRDVEERLALDVWPDLATVRQALSSKARARFGVG
ncbi:MAG: non-homologous end-joining DNA ligase [Myxococcota bacterium]